MVLFLLILIGVAVILYRNYQGENVTKYITSQVETLYNRFAPYSFKVVREKAKDLGQEFTAKQYLMQVVILGGFAGIVTYLYFYNLLVSIAYVILAILAVPYLAFLRCKRIYSEFVFEQIQVYTTNVIMEFATTQSFVKSLEGVRDSGVLEDPVLADVNVMIDMAYENGSIDEAIEYMKVYKGSRFPKEIVDALLQFTAVYPAGSTVLLTNGQTGKVVRQNKDFSDRPVIELKNHDIIDLVKINNVFIEKVLE